MSTLPVVPRIQLDGFTIRGLELPDVSSWASYAMRPEVQAHTSSSAKTEQDLVPIIEGANAGGASASVYFAVCKARSADVIGTVGFHSVSELNRAAEITYDVHPDLWGQGVGSHACAAALAWGFEARHWMRVQATVLEENAASRRVLEKCGFELEGTLRNLRMVRGGIARLPRVFLCA